MPDAADYGDAGSDTLGNLARVRPLNLPHLCRLGLGNIRKIDGLPAAPEPLAFYGCCALASPGKDTTTGHWEMAGIHLDRPLPVYPNGFPSGLMREFEERIGRGTLGNYPASGTEIIRELGEDHMRTGSPIVYTSADSVFQIAAHEEVIPLWELYKICETARALLRGEHEVGRVIARPFIGLPGDFARTTNRKDYASPPPRGMLLDQLEERDVEVYAVGKIIDIYVGRGVRRYVKTKSNAEGMAETGRALDLVETGVVFTNLVDFDMLYGHRNNAEGYAKALEEFDAWLPALEQKLGEGDLLILCADHGCDPTTPSTDHSREYTPLLAYNPRLPRGASLGVRASLSDIGQTVAENFGAAIPKGQSFLHQIV